MSENYKDRFILRETSVQKPAVREDRDIREVWQLPATFKDDGKKMRGKDASSQS